MCEDPRDWRCSGTPSGTVEGTLQGQEILWEAGGKNGAEKAPKHTEDSLAFRRLTKQLGDSKHVCTQVKMSQLIHQYAFESGSN